MQPDDGARLRPLLRNETLAARSYLERRGELQEKIYFIETGVISNLETSDIRTPLEVGVVGCEGIVGASAICNLFPQRDSCVQIEGAALTLDREQFQALVISSSTLLAYLLRYIQTQIVQLSLAASAGVRATVQQRLARKLLMYHDRIGQDDLPLTHENMSIMLGVRRASITHAIHNLEAERWIKATRGLVQIRDRAGLIKYCGPFYGVAEARYLEIMGHSQ
ncbi:Crp/Fnr family transcriptional regulator [Novosphingobium sp. BL-8A]|uniref:Crp/Fnr family transcriptional regulator n=1 Tax=Novosphingobium sp. BL-8A TaxID=3127639 RepID=UPI0037562EAF